MTKEVEEYVAKLDELESRYRECFAAKEAIRTLCKEQDEKRRTLTSNENKKLYKKEKEYDDQLKSLDEKMPTPPAKREKKPLFPSATKAGLQFAVALLLSILFLVICISSQVKSARIESLREDYGEAYVAWCDILISKNDFSKMTEADWEPVRKEFKKAGVSLHWTEVVALDTEGAFDKAQGAIYEHSTANYVRREMLNVLLKDEEPSAFGFVISALLLLSSLITLFVLKREGFPALKATLAKDIWQIFAVRKINKENVVSFSNQNDS